MRCKEEFKAGDKWVVTGLPEGMKWFSPRGQADLKNGDVLTVYDRPIYQNALIGSNGDHYEWGVHFNLPAKLGIVVVIPPDWMSPQKGEISETKFCVCSIINIMSSGCTCGAFAKEQAKLS